jgi:protein O-GlcNAc transferase
MATLQPSSAQVDFTHAFEHHNAGRLAEAAALYRKVVAAEPGHVDALHLLGMIMAQATPPKASD